MSIKTAVLGGSFDPVHLGHMFALECAIKNTDYRHFIIVPAKLSNFKQNSRPVASDKHRMNMLEIALEDFRRNHYIPADVSIEISDIEIARGGISYTSDTIRQLISLYNLDKAGMIIGDDHLEKLQDWHDFDYLKKNVCFLICPRENTKEVWDKIPAGLDYIRICENTTSPESSSSIRSGVYGFENYLSDGVLDYVRKNKLYN